MAVAKQFKAEHDMTIQVVSRHVVKASPCVEPYVLAVSNLDLIHRSTQSSVACIYRKPASGDFSAVTAAFHAELPAFLNYFFPLAGRIVTNTSSGHPEVQCCNQGAELVIGHAGVDLGSLDWSRSDESLNRIKLAHTADVALSVQLVSFTCGGFAVVWATNSLIAGDGEAASMLVRMWSEFLCVGTIAVPNHDRSLFLRPRDPPSYDASMDGMFTPWHHEHEVNTLTAQENLVERLYYVHRRDIERLRQMASRGGQRSSRVQALSAYIWKVVAGVVAASTRQEKRCRMGWWVDGRQRLRAPALRNYVGNATTYVVEEAAVDTILQAPLADVAATVREAITSVDYEERYKQVVDWLEKHNPAPPPQGGRRRRFVEAATVGLGSPTVSQMVWASFAGDTDFGFGEAALAMPMPVSASTMKLCSGYLCVVSRPADEAPWIIRACIWPRLAAALESDEQRIFNPLTAEFLGFSQRRSSAWDARPRL
ncbi:coniferyl alcohol acyltransferase-like [Hordeum vulgare subsp. vulgare]|uniref:coniferyl alcohol acyltransferase-like n=1 Tax=Hordeum vulgare subsp. vulgare TaxID=112509 RepID=UPI000B46C9E8|nr:coniferyl alcohol acyltransferase-like [Hordeum vulgare subsp. vulgare]